MKRLVLAALVATTAAALPAMAAADGARTLSRSYAGGGFAGFGPAPGLRGHGHAQGGDLQAVTATPLASERRLRLTVADEAGRPVAVEVTQTTPDGREIEVTEGCRRTLSSRLPVRAGDVTVWLLAGACGDGWSTPTAGTVTFRFSR